MAKQEKKILIIDDEKDICKYEKLFFERWGFEVLTAQTGEAGIKLVKSKKPDMAIIDIHMEEGMDGLLALQKIRSLRPECKCIMVTWDEEKAKEAKKLGAVDYIIKPNEIKDIEKAVKKAFAGKGGAK